VRRAAGTSGRHLGADAAATALALAAAVAGGIAAGVLVARALGPAGRGAFELARTIASVAATAAGLGVGGAAVFLRPRGELEEGQILGAVAGALATGALAAAALDLLLTATGWLPLGPLHLAMVCAAIPLIAFYYQAQAALQGFGGGAWYRRTLAARDALFLVLLVAAFWRERTLTLLLAVWDAHWLLSAAAVAALLVRRCGRPRLPRVRRLVAIGSSQLLLTLLVRAHLRLDVVLLAALRGPHTLGEYAVAVGAAQPLAYAGVAVSTALYPRSAASSARAPGGGAVATARAVRTTLALALAGAAVLAVAGPSLVTAVFGAGFAAAGTPLRVLLPGVVAMTAFLALQSDLAGRGRARVVAASSLAAVAANLGLNALLIPRLGATGAAAASSVTYVLAAVLLVRLFARETGVPARACLLVRADDVRAVAALLCRLHVAPWPGLRPLGEVARRRVARAMEQGRASPERARRAEEALRNRLLQSPSRPRLLHGDFDDRNLLRGRGRDVVAIDPLPLPGDPAYDAAFWAHANGRPGRRDRIGAIAAAAGLEEERVRLWAEVVAAHG